MIDSLIERIKNDKENLTKYQHFFVEREIPSKYVLLGEGEIATNIFFIKNGCLRMWFNKDGKDITLQFFFENQFVASIESFESQNPSLFTIESIEPTSLVSVSKENFELLLNTYPELKNMLQRIIFQRFRNYARLFLSRIKDTPSGKI